MEAGISHETMQRRRKPGRLSRSRAALLMMLLMPIAGCHSLKQMAPPAEKPASPDKEPALALPNKHSLRVAQFLFLADFKIRDDHPLFRELSELHETVAKELQLPSSNRVVQVYLFDDKERYKRFI